MSGYGFYARDSDFRRLTKATGTVAQEARSARDRLVSQEKLVKEAIAPTVKLGRKRK